MNDKKPSPDKDKTPLEGKVTSRDTGKKPKEYGGPEGPEPTRYGDWEKGGRCSDF